MTRRELVEWLKKENPEHSITEAALKRYEDVLKPNHPPIWLIVEIARLATVQRGICGVEEPEIRPEWIDARVNLGARKKQAAELVYETLKGIVSEEDLLLFLSTAVALGDILFEEQLQELEGVSPEQRGAVFRCVIAVAVLDHEPLVVEGTLRGYINFEPRGRKGFGYDPLFLVPGSQKSLAELDPREKNRISHRARAVKRLLEEWPEFARKIGLETW